MRIALDFWQRILYYVNRGNGNTQNSKEEKSMKKRSVVTSLIAAAALTMSMAAVNVGAEAETSPVIKWRL